MNILIVCNGVIPALKYGGTQRVIWYLGKELARMGHKVTYLVDPGSTCDFARVIYRNPQQTVDEQIPEDIDVVHFNNTPERIRKPHIVTVHGNGISFADDNAVFVSNDHAQRHGYEAYVYNGMDWDDYGKADLTKPRKGYHFLGKAAWRVKNVKGAIAVAEGLHTSLEVLGGHRLNLKMGFRFTLNPRIHFHGMIDNAGKKKYIEQSRGLVFPVTWCEPFGLAITESLYYGSPVFGTPYGSLPELVPANVGFLSAKAAEIIAHCREAEYSVHECHEYARDLFNSKVMAEAYLAYYEKVLNGQVLNPKKDRPALEAYKNLKWE